MEASRKVVLAAVQFACSDSVSENVDTAESCLGLALVFFNNRLHFDHGSSKSELVEALELGFDSVMVDGSHLPLMENIYYTKYISVLAHSKGMLVEAELGRLSGTEDDLTVEDYEAKLTDASQAQEFIDKTGIDALAVCMERIQLVGPISGSTC